MSYQEALNLLELDETYTERELKEKHSKLVKQNHPDLYEKEGKEVVAFYNAKMQKINEAYLLLKKKFKNPVSNEASEEDIKKFKRNWMSDISNLRKNYKNSSEILNICRYYEGIIRKFSTKEELEIQKEEFNQKIENCKKKILLNEEKEKFNEDLKFTRKYHREIEFSLLTIRYLELLQNVYSIKELEDLKKKYQVEVEKTKKELERKRIEEERLTLEENLKSYQNRYHDLETINLIHDSFDKLKKCVTLEEIETLSNSFKKSFQAIRSKERIFLEKKAYITREIKRYTSLYFHSGYQEVANKYLEKLKDIEEVSTLNSLETDFNKELEALKLQDKKDEKFYTIQKLILKKASLSIFCTYIKDVSFEKATLAGNILKMILTMIKNTSKATIDRDMKVISSVNYQDLEFERGKLEFYKLIKEKKMNIKIDKLLEKQDSKEDVVEEEGISTSRKTLKDKIILKYYEYTLSKDIGEILSSFDLFFMVLKTINEMEEVDLIENYSLLANLDFHDPSKVKEILGDLKESNKVFVSFENGKLYSLSRLDDKVLQTPLDPLEGVSIITKLKARSDFISLHEFLKKAEPVGEETVIEVINPYFTSPILYNPGDLYLYIYKNLMLLYNFIDKKFRFMKSRKKYGFRKTKSNLRVKTQLLIDLSNLDICEERLMDQIKREYQKNLEEEEKRI